MPAMPCLLRSVAGLALGFRRPRVLSCRVSRVLNRVESSPVQSQATSLRPSVQPVCTRKPTSDLSSEMRTPSEWLPQLWGGMSSGPCLDPCRFDFTKIRARDKEHAAVPPFSPSLSGTSFGAAPSSLQKRGKDSTTLALPSSSNKCRHLFITSSSPYFLSQP